MNDGEATIEQIHTTGEVFPPEITKEKLIQLLLYLETEIIYKDKTIAALKEEKAKLILFETKYRLLCPADPVYALTRDAKFVSDVQNGTGIVNQLENQMHALDKIYKRFDESYQKMLQVVKSTENRLDIAIDDLAVEREWKNSAVSNEIVHTLREQNHRLKEEIDRNNTNFDISKKEMVDLELRSQADRERHRNIFIFLMNDRRELISAMNEMFRKSNSEISTFEQQSVIDNLKKDLQMLRVECDLLTTVNSTLKSELVTMKEVARVQEEEMELLRDHLVGMVPRMSIGRNMDDGCVIMRNGVATMKASSYKPSLPSDKSRLPRAHGQSPSTIASITSKALLVKKTPAMGVSTMRRTVGRKGISSEDGFKLTRSSSLRGKSEPRHLDSSIPSIRTCTITKSPSNGANVSPTSSPTSIETSNYLSQSDAKASQITKPKNSLLFRAFGK
uniref:Cortactin-binding protein-2 N-terminal domain-containing protein n=1 Tax=Pristionchus pacificus TaxID=54126 RepID=A0A8R1YIM4_PRIPA